MYKIETKKDPGGSLVDYAFYGKNRKLLMKTYSFDTSKKESDIAEHIIRLEEDERVIGFQSKSSKAEPGHHFDIRFKIAKLLWKITQKNFLICSSKSIPLVYFGTFSRMFPLQQSLILFFEKWCVLPMLDRLGQFMRFFHFLVFTKILYQI